MHGTFYNMRIYKDCFSAFSGREDGKATHNMRATESMLSLKRRHELCFFLLLLSVVSPLSSAFVPLSRLDNKQAMVYSVGSTTRHNSEEGISTESPADRFHADMRRVLESRAKLSSDSTSSVSSAGGGIVSAGATLERRYRPQVLSSDIDGAERVRTMLEHMVQIGVATEESYQIVLKALRDRGRIRWKRSGEIVCAADEAFELMEELWQQSSNNDKLISAETCNIVLQIYAVCSTPRGNRRYAQRAQKLVEQMETSGIPVNVESLSPLVHAWAWQQANMQPGECVRKAMESLDRIIELSPNAETLLQCYDWVLEAESKSGSDGSAQAAEKLLLEMKNLQKEVGKDCILPNAQSYTNGILAWSKCKDEVAAERAHSLLVETLELFKQGKFIDQSEPELIAFNGVVTAWARMARSDKAEEVLWMMEDIRMTCKNLVPDVVTYNSVLHAHVRSSDKAKALDRILTVVKYMEDQATAQPLIKPDSFTYNTVMKAWIQSRRPNSAEKAEKILHKMEKLWEGGDQAVQPTNRHYNVVINALAKSKSQHLGARKAYDLLQKMHGSETCKPDIITYTSVIECFSKSSDPKAPEIAQELLQQATDMYEAEKDSTLMPNLRTFTMVILVLSKTPNPENVAKANDLLTRLIELYEETKDDVLKPNAYPYNYAINCAANCLGTTKEKISAFQIAAGIYKDIRKSSIVKPDSYTYSFWIKCCNNLLPVGALRAKCVTHAFHQCSTEGLVSAEVLKRLLGGSPPDILSTLLNIPPKTPPAIYRQMTLDDVPLKWSRNI